MKQWNINDYKVAENIYKSQKRIQKLENSEEISKKINDPTYKYNKLLSEANKAQYKDTKTTLLRNKIKPAWTTPPSTTTSTYEDKSNTQSTFKLPPTIKKNVSEFEFVIENLQTKHSKKGRRKKK